MDPIAPLIGKLNEQFQQNAPAEHLLATLRSIESVLLQGTHTLPKSLGTAKVAVILPPIAVPELSTSPAVEHQPSTPTDQPGSLPEAQPSSAPSQVSSKRSFDPIIDIPTLAHQQNGKEINESIQSTPFSVNDKLKNEVVEVGQLLTSTPIRDLKKAIGINDRFVFINELFRGDDTMYERSIKTINGFRILAEAEYWIDRELKVKLGWSEESPVVQHFCQLIKRRFLGV